ncbi:MAG: hypothetical protein ACXQTS_00985 [Candidatus Methanospirareceae archaeon]
MPVWELVQKGNPKRVLCVDGKTRSEVLRKAREMTGIKDWVCYKYEPILVREEEEETSKSKRRRRKRGKK